MPHTMGFVCAFLNFAFRLGSLGIPGSFFSSSISRKSEEFHRPGFLNQTDLFSAELLSVWSLKNQVINIDLISKFNQLTRSSHH